MLKYLQLPFMFDAERMKMEVNAISNLYWKEHFQKLHYTGNWSGIALRSLDGNPDNIYLSHVEDPEFHDTLLLEQSIYLREVIKTFKCKITAARLLKLEAGAVIKEHKDHDLNYENDSIRIHVPVITDDEIEFYLDKERIQMKEGEAWYLNLNLPHSINNKSSIDRIHLVIDMKVNEWVKKLFTSDEIKNKKEVADVSEGYDTETKKQIITQFRIMNTETSNRMADEMEATMQA